MRAKDVRTGPKRELTVGEVARRSGVAVSALHFYETKGLIKSWRNAGNQRRYARDVLRRVALIKVAQKTGIPLLAIRRALKSLPGERTPTAEDWKKLSAGWRAELNDRIERLTRLRGPIGRMQSVADACRSGFVRCGIRRTRWAGKDRGRESWILFRRFRLWSWGREICGGGG